MRCFGLAYFGFHVIHHSVEVSNLATLVNVGVEVI